MSDDFSVKPIILFELFELEPQRSTLRSNGLNVNLQRQPLNVLALLARRQGQLVTREEIRRQIWGDETFVDFENGINFCVRQIRAALGDDSNNPRYIETVRGRGYRFLPPTEFTAQLRFSQPHPVPVQHSSDAIVIIVLPFDNLSKSSEHESLADGMTEVVITNLTKINGFKVISRKASMRYKGVRRPAQEIAKELRMDFVLAGTVLGSARGVRITAQLIDAATDQNLWAGSYERNDPNVLSLQGEVGWVIANEISNKLLSSQAKNLRSIHTMSPEAYRAYVKGRSCWNTRTEAGLKKAIKYFEQAINLSPRCALAYAALTDCYLISSQIGLLHPQEAYPQARAAAAKALDLDITLAEAHGSMGYCKMISDWEWKTAEKEFRLAIALDPNCAQAHQWYADYLTAMRRHSEAVAEMRRALELDPFSMMIDSDVGWSLSHANLYDQAIEHYRRVIAKHPSFVKARWGLGISCLHKSMFKEAVLELQKAFFLSPGNPMILAALGYAHALSGNRAQALKLLARLRKRSRCRYVPSYEIATFYLGLGDKERAYAWLQKAYSERSAYLVYLAVDPRFENGRFDPRLRTFTSLLGLPS